MIELTDKEINDLVRKWFKELLDDDEDYRISLNKPKPISRHFETLENYSNFKAEALEQLALSDYSGMSHAADSLLEANNIKLDPDSFSFKKLCREMLKAGVRFDDIIMNREKGIYDTEVDTIYSEPVRESHYRTRETEDETTPISKVIESYTSEAKVNWTEKTEGETLSSLNLLLAIFGDVPIRSITIKKMVELKEILKNLPPNMNKSPKYKGKSIKQLVEMEKDKTLSNRTINKHLTRIGTLFEYAMHHGTYTGSNPAIGLRLPKEKADRERRAPYTIEELQRLFRSEEYINDTHSKEYRFWLPILALFTGARRYELAQLHLSDIQKEDSGVWYIDINDKADTKKLKTDSSRRIIPIHPFILELSFIERVKKLISQGEVRLFPELKKGRDGYGRAVGTWFNDRYKIECGIVSNDGRLRDFHSFRTTFITRLKHLKVSKSFRFPVQGHAEADDMDAVYAEEYPAQMLFDEVVSKLDFHESVDLSHLKESKYVIKM